MSKQTKRPAKTVTEQITVTAADTLTGEKLTAHGTVTVHKYRDHTRLVFAKVKTPFGLATLKLSFRPQIGWRKDSEEMPCVWLSVAWGAATEIVQRLAGA